MAIAKMQKLTLIFDAKQTSDFLEQLQAIQQIELSELQLENHAVQSYFTAYQETADDSIIQAQLDEVTTALKILLPLSEKDSLLKTYYHGRPVLTFEALNQQVATVDWITVTKKVIEKAEQLKNLENQFSDLTAQEQALIPLTYFAGNPSDFQNFKHVQLQIMTIDNRRTADFVTAMNTSPNLFIQNIYQGQETDWFLVVWPMNQQEIALKELQGFHLQSVNYPYQTAPKTAEIEIKQLLKTNSQQQTELRQELKSLANHRNELELVEEWLLTQQLRLKAKQILHHSEYLTILTGWLPEAGQPTFNQLVKDYFQNQPFYLQLHAPIAGDIDSVPIELKNGPIVGPFETLTEMYSLPKYDEMDPTPIMTPFYLVFFGMMAADVGYGLVLGIATFIILKYFNVDRPLRKNIAFFHNLAYPTVLWGLIYGSFFGMNLPFHLLSTTTDINQIMILSVVFGFIQILTGLFTNAYLHLRNGEVLGALSEGFSWVGILVGLALVAGSVFLKIPLMNTIGLVLAIIGAVLVLLQPIITSKNPGIGLAQGLYNLYGITGYIGDLVSYTRLMALGISGGSIAAAFNMLVGFLPPLFRFTIGVALIVALHLLNMFLSFLSAYVHGARLQYVEFFGKFYQGGGRKFTPFKAAEKYIYVAPKSTHSNK